ncbi:hypothetical protein BD408DRAFT_428555 [Parasitella parasitica]|nr:hypothetical protein BD408DRAFT_428555 [Parasitella parasitica]
MDYLSNCVFGDESAFDINMRPQQQNLEYRDQIAQLETEEDQKLMDLARESSRSPRNQRQKVLQLEALQKEF